MKKNNYLKYAGNFLVTVSIAVLAACGNKSNNNPAPVVQPANGYQACVNCQNINGATFFTAQSQDMYNVILLNWNFTGQNVGMINQTQMFNGSNYNYQLYNSPIVSYNGPVGAQGQLSVSQGLNLGSCQLPIGSYSLGTLSAGQWSAGLIYNLRLQASGPAQIVMTLSQGQVSAKTGSQLGQTWSEINPVGRVFGNLLIESVNGYPCQTSVLVE